MYCARSSEFGTCMLSTTTTAEKMGCVQNKCVKNTEARKFLDVFVIAVVVTQSFNRNRKPTVSNSFSWFADFAVNCVARQRIHCVIWIFVLNSSFDFFFRPFKCQNVFLFIIIDGEPFMKIDMKKNPNQRNASNCERHTIFTIFLNWIYWNVCISLSFGIQVYVCLLFRMFALCLSNSFSSIRFVSVKMCFYYKIKYIPVQTARREALRVSQNMVLKRLHVCRSVEKRQAIAS